MRALRVRRQWRQTDLGRRAGLSRDAVSRAELGKLDGLTVGPLDRLCEALEATLVVEIGWQGAALGRLVDRVHAQLQDEVARWLTAAGWIVRVEVSFNHYGDRGSCDLVAWHPVHRILLIIEVKTKLGNLQDTLRRLDTKVRLAAVIARDLGCADSGVRGEGVGARGGEHQSPRRRPPSSASRELRDPGPVDPTMAPKPNGLGHGLLWLQSLSDSGDRSSTDAKRVGTRRPAG